jgi:uroporphyrinogen-III synthase
VYVFTSPSNLAAFLQKNRVPEAAKVIAWGNTTEKALRNSKVQVSRTLITAQLEELLEVLANF